MRIPEAITLASALLCIFAGAFSLLLSRAPRWPERQWFALTAFGAALFNAFVFPTTLDDVSPGARFAFAAVAMCGANLSVLGWVMLSRIRLRQPVSHFDRLLFALLVVTVPMMAVPGLAIRVAILPVHVGWLHSTYRLLLTTPLGDAIYALDCFALLVALLRYARGVSWRSGAARWNVLGLAALLLAGANDACTGVGLYSGPQLLALAYLFPIAAVAMTRVERLVRSACELDELSGKLTNQNRSLTDLKESLLALTASLDARVAERTKALSDANGLLKNETVERQKIELELRLAQKLELVGRLDAGVAHDINTPVQFISDSVRFIQDAMRELIPLLGLYQEFESLVTASGATQRSEALVEQRERADLDYVLVEMPRALDWSLEGLGRVAEIVRSMKVFAHPDRTTMGTLDINKAIESTLTVARGEYKLVAEVEKQLGELPQVSCYAGEINQVLLNIIVNAARD